MARGNFRKLCDYDNKKEDWRSYVEHVEIFFTANDVVDVQKKKVILLTSCVRNTNYLKDSQHLQSPWRKHSMS